MNQTEQTTQINNTINLLSTKIEYSTCIIFEPIPSVHPTSFSKAKDSLQDTKHGTKAIGGQRLPWQMLAPCDNFELVF